MLIFAGFSSCDKYDDSEIWEKVNDLLGRVQKLEAACEQQNSNIAALQTMLNGLKDNMYVTSVEEMEDGKGYVMTFSNDESINIYHGKDGLNGEDGETPTISVVKEGDNYYWTVNGEILKDGDGNNISADGSGVTPLLKTGSQLESEGVEGSWDKEAVYVSVDNVTWKTIVTGESTQIFTSVEISENKQNVIITLSDGSTIALPKMEKVLAMLYGTWSMNIIYDEEIVVFTFNEDNTCYFEIGDNEQYQGTFRFIPDRYIECIVTSNEGEICEFVFSIVEITDKSLILNGSDLCEGAYTRVLEADFNENVILGSWQCYEYDSAGDLQDSYVITFKEGGELELSYDKPVVGTTWS